MDIRSQFRGMSQDEIIEVSYLVGRYLTHKIDDDAFRSMFLADTPSSFGAAPYAKALDIVRSIESEEARPVKDLSQQLRDRYMLELCNAVKEFGARAFDPKMVEEVRNELEELRF